MATTLANLIDDCEADLADSGNATWAATDIEQWCRDAIADYSQHFPRTLTEDITMTADDQQYDLPAGFVNVLSAELPQGEDPPVFLERRRQTHDRFWTEDGYYDIIARLDDTDPPEILISTNPTTDDTLRIIHTAVHDFTIITSANLTVPEQHHHILRNYVLWRAALQLKSTEEASPTSNSSLLMSQLAINVDRARRSYVDALAKVVYTQVEGGYVSWADKNEVTGRIY